MKRVTYSLQAGYRKRLFIMLSFSHDTGRFRKSTGIQVDRDHWLTDRMRVAYTHHKADTINRMLDLWENRVMEAYLAASVAKVRLTDAMLQEAIEPARAVRPASAPDLLTYFSGFIDVRARSGRFAHQSIKNLRSFHNILAEYQGMVGILHFDLIDDAWVEAFRLWLTQKRKLAVNTVSKHFRVLSTILRAAAKQKIPVKTDFQALRIGEMPSHNVYLSLDELERLEACELSVRLRNAVDVFLIGCFTGLRYSDFSRFRIENIRSVRGAEMIYIKQQKTGEDVVIPLHPVVRRVIDRNGGLPKMISSQKLNDYIKEACQLAGINDKIVHYFNAAGKTQSIVVEKWELVSSHTARRSCATNMHIAGIDSKLIMKLTGHKKESTFMKYLCIDNEESALLLSRSSFFK